MELSRRAQSLKPSPTLALAAKAKELVAKGHPVISLSVGEPDWDTYAAIKVAGVSSIEAGQTKYAPSAGLIELRRAIAHQTSKDLGVAYSDQDVVVTAGAKMVLFAALQMMCDPGDEVIVPSPYWVSYPTMIELADGVPVIVAGDSIKNGRLQAGQLGKALTSKTKIVLLNSPSNPTGEVHTREELLAIAEVLRKWPKVQLISDDIYNRLVFTGDPVAPHILHVAPDLRDRVLVVNGASKTWSMTGWRVGWALGDRGLMQAMSNYLSQSVSCASPFAQAAALAGFSEAVDVEVRRSVEDLIRRRDRVLRQLRHIDGLEVAVPQGAFYLWPKISKFLGRTYKGQTLATDSDFCRLLLEHEHVAVVPGGEFGGPGHLRMSFVVSDSDMDEALVRIQRFIADLN